MELVINNHKGNLSLYVYQSATHDIHICFFLDVIHEPLKCWCPR